MRWLFLVLLVGCGPLERSARPMLEEAKKAEVKRVELKSVKEIHLYYASDIWEDARSNILLAQAKYKQCRIYGSVEAIKTDKIYLSAWADVVLVVPLSKDDLIQFKRGDCILVDCYDLQPPDRESIGFAKGRFVRIPPPPPIHPYNNFDGPERSLEQLAAEVVAWEEAMATWKKNQLKP